MDEALLEQVLLAVQVSYSPQTPPNERQTAYAFCEQFKTRDDCALYALAIYKRPQSELPTTTASLEIPTRQHFALHCLEDHIVYKWRSLSTEEQTRLRDELVQLLLVTCPGTEEPNFLKEKKVALLAQVAKRQFPQRWPNFLPDLIQVWQSGSNAQIEMIIRVLRSVAEDCATSHFNSSIPPARRKDILQGLNASLAQLLPVVYRELEQRYIAYQNGDTTSRPLIEAAMEMLKAFLEWMPVDQPIAPSSNLFLVAVQLLSDSALRMSAVDCLETYMTRTFGKENLQIFLDASATLLDKVSQLNLIDLEPEIEENLRFHCKVNDVLVTWGSNHIDLLLSDRPDTQTRGYTLLVSGLQTLVKLFNHPSALIAETQAALWLNLIKNKQIAERAADPTVYQLLTHLRQLCFDKYFKFGSPEREDPPGSLACAVSALDFDDQHEFVVFYGNLRGRLYGLIRALVQLDVPTALQMVYDRLNFVYTQHASAVDYLSSAGQATELSAAYIYHEGVTALLECVVKQLPSSAMTDASNCQTMQSLVQLLLTYSTSDPLLKYRQLYAFSSFVKFYEQDASQLTPVFELLFAHIEYVQQGETSLANLKSDTMNVRRRALSSLVNICQGIPGTILPVLPTLCTKAQELFAAERVNDSEGVMLYEMLVLVSNSMESAQERQDFVYQVAQQPLAQWNDASISDLVSSPERLVQTVENAYENADARKRLHQVIKCLTTLYGVAKRAAANYGRNQFDAFEPQWGALLPNLVALIRTMHALQEPATKAAVLKTSSACWLLVVSMEELAQLLGGKHMLTDEQLQQLPVAAKWSKWSKNVRDVAYHILGLAFSQSQFYRQTDMVSTLQSTLLTGLETMEHRHVKILLSYAVATFVKKCPTDMYTTVLQPVLSQILEHLMQRLAHCFKTGNLSTGEVGTVKGQDTPWMSIFVGMETAKQDVAQEKMLLDLTREVVELLEALVDGKIVVGTDTSNPKHVMSPEDQVLRTFVLSTQHAMPIEVVRLLCLIMGWMDTMSARKATNLADKIVSLVYTEQSMHDVLGRELFVAGVTALFNEQEKEDGLRWDLINLLRNIYCRLVLGVIPVDECKGIDPCNQPLPPASTLCTTPREVLLSLPEMEAAQVEALETYLRGQHGVKSQKNAVKEVLEVPLQAVKRMRAKGSSMDTSCLALGQGRQIPDLPEKLVIASKESEAAARQFYADHADLTTTSLFEQ